MINSTVFNSHSLQFHYGFYDNGPAPPYHELGVTSLRRPGPSLNSMLGLCLLAPSVTKHNLSESAIYSCGLVRRAGTFSPHSTLPAVPAVPAADGVAAVAAVAAIAGEDQNDLDTVCRKFEEYVMP